MTTRIAAVLGVLLALTCSCGDDASSPVDGLVVVQETNLTACTASYSYDTSVVRSCDGTSAKVQVCSDSQLCDAQIEDLTRRVRSCEAPDEPERLTTTLGCPGDD